MKRKESNRGGGKNKQCDHIKSNDLVPLAWRNHALKIIHTIEVGALRLSEARLEEDEPELPCETPPRLLTFPLAEGLCCQLLAKAQGMLINN